MKQEHLTLRLLDARRSIQIAWFMLIGAMLILTALGAGVLTLFFALFLFFVGCLSFLITYHINTHTEVKRLLVQDSAFENSVVDVGVSVANRSPFGISLSMITDDFPPSGVRAQLVHVDVPVLSAQERTVAFQHLCRSKRGPYRTGAIQFHHSDPLGLSTMRRFDRSAHPFVVYPEPVRLHASSDAVARRFSTGVAHNVHSGSGMDFAGVRPFAEWDDVRYIHWQASARSGSLVVRDMHEEGSSHVTIFLDLSRRGLSGLGRHSTTEYGIRLATSIANNSLRAGHELQLVANDGAPIYLPYGRGTSQFTRVMNTLANVKPEGEHPLHELLLAHTATVCRGSMAYVLFAKSDIALDATIASLRMLQAKAVRLIAIVVDHTTFLPLHEVHQRAHADHAWQALTKLGMTVYRVANTDDLERVMASPVVTAEHPL